MTYQDKQSPLRVALLSMPLALAACHADLEKLFDKLSGTTTNTVVFAKTAATLKPTPMRFAAAEPMQVVGTSASVCIVLSGGVPMQARASMDSAVDKIKRGAALEVNAIGEDGKKHPLTSIGQAWAMSGKVVEHDEVAECYSARCDETLPIGSKFVAVDIAATPALEIKGGYWTSTNAFDKYQPRSNAPPAKSTAAAPEKTLQANAGATSKCLS